MQIQFAIDGQPCCILSLHATTRERKEPQGDAWYHYPFIELRTLAISMEGSTGNLTSTIVDRCYFEPKECDGYTELSEALTAAKTWITDKRGAMAATIQEDYGNGLP